MSRVVIIGSGPTGAAFARTLLEEAADASVLMVELGPAVTEPPGSNVRNLPTDEERAAARRASQGPAADGPLGLGLPSGTVIEGTFTARQGTHLVQDGLPGSNRSPGMPAAALITCVGGGGAHWTCAVPRPEFSERVDFIPDAEWTVLVGRAEHLLSATSDAFAGAAVAPTLLAAVAGELDTDLPEGFRSQLLPVAGHADDSGGMLWAGTDTVLGPLLGEGPLAHRFELRPLTRARRVIVEGRRAAGVELEDVATGRRWRERADLVLIAADALRTPQLLWASGIRPVALGHYLNEHPAVLGVVAVRPGVLDDVVLAEVAKKRDAGGDPVAAVIRVPFSEPHHPYSGQIMFTASCPIPLEPGTSGAGNPAGYVSLGWGTRKFPRWADALTFSDDHTDRDGFPLMTIDYALTPREEAELADAELTLRRVAGALGEFVSGGEPRVMPPGSSMHYQGTTRIGASDDGTSVCDAWSRIWGYEGVVLAGNGMIPTATSVNPTLFSVALAVRAALAAADSLRD